MSDPVRLLFFALAGLRLVLFVSLIYASTQLIYDLSTRPRRRKTNPSIRSGLVLLSGASVGLTLLVVRLVLLQVGGGRIGWLLFDRDPDLLGALGGALCSLIAVGGVLLLIRGVRGMVFPGDNGALPRGLGPTT